MQAKKWLLAALLSVLSVAVLFSLCNMLAALEGIYNDHFFRQYGNDLTQNSLGVKIAWLEQGDLNNNFCDTVRVRNHGDDMSLSIPTGDDLGSEKFHVMVTPENAGVVIRAECNGGGSAGCIEVDVPILMYHSFTEHAADITGTTVLISDFEAQLQALQRAGYTSVDYEDLIAFVESGAALPERPILISIDDGYQNNLDLAAPLLEKYGFSATIAVIGISVGRATYKNSDTPIIPHFTLEDALPWVKKGVLTLVTHSYDMHQVASLDGEACRRGALQMDGESGRDYIAALTRDYQQAQKELAEVLGNTYPVYIYPYGYYSMQSEVVLRELGVRVSVTTEAGMNKIIKGIPQSLYALRRINVEGALGADAMMERIRACS